jgi:mono/diheme cytochrome c family protein
MYESPLVRMRRRVGVGMFSVGVVGLLWFFTPGWPVSHGPSAPAELKLAGLELFQHEWEPNDPLAQGDGLGPVFNARSCASCHFQGGVGGGGDNAHNVTAFEAFPTQDRKELKGGLIHRFAVADQFLEGSKELNKIFPILPEVTLSLNGCQVQIRDFNPVHTQNVNSTALFGAGWIDRISGKTIRHQSMTTSTALLGREMCGDLFGVPAGRPRILPDGRVGKFGWKAQFATLQEFVAAACANEIGLGNPVMPQATPAVCHNYPPVENDLNPAQFSSLVAFVDTLPRPIEAIPNDPEQRGRAERGRQFFRVIGCAECHTPDMDGVSGVYSDFLLHHLDDRKSSDNFYENATPVPLPEDHPLPDEWKTPPLWGVADSAPYFHDGRSATLEQAVLRHHGDAENIRITYENLSSDDRAAIIAFLKTLRAPADAPPAPSPVVVKGRIAMK